MYSDVFVQVYVLLFNLNVFISRTIVVRHNIIIWRSFSRARTQHRTDTSFINYYIAVSF